jgi:L-iditol 2-dehydrogenase
LLAGILTEPGRIELHEVPKPSVSDGEVLVRVKAALTCGTDLKAYRRGHPVIPMPGPFGHEFSGIVEETGKGVRRFRRGDEVMTVHSAPCLSCVFCRKKIYNLCDKIMNTKILGAFAEFIVVPAHIIKQNAFKKPHNISFEEASFLEPLSCVVHGISSLHIKEGDRVLVIGAGPIGLLHLLLLKEKGAVVSMMDMDPKRLRMARRFKADANFQPERIEPALARLTGGIGFDAVFECTGSPNVWENAVCYVRKGGTIVLFGGCKPGTRVSYSADRIHYDEITLKGSFHYSPSDVEKAYGMLSSGRMNVSQLISGTYSLKHVEKAFMKLDRGEGIKYAIIPGK